MATDNKNVQTEIPSDELDAKKISVLEGEFISKRELLRAARISYGTLYRWKRMNLIPEEWFIHKATKTGQATFFPREKVLNRIGRIQELKGDLSAMQLQEIFSPNVSSFLIPVDDFMALSLVGKLAMSAFQSVFPDRKNLRFNDIFAIYVVDHLMRLSGIYLEDAKKVIRMLEASLKTQRTKEFKLILMRKMGIPFTILVKEKEDLLLEDEVEIVACADLAEFEDALKEQLIA